MPALKDTIAALFERAASEPSATGTVQRGLNLKARIVDGQRQLLLSRPDVQPSDLEVTTCAKHGEIAAYTVTQGARWQLISEELDQCDHVKGFSGMGDGKAEHFYFGSCITCKARWQRVVSRRGKAETFTYNGQDVQEWQFKLLTVRGPKGDPSTETDDERALRQIVEERQPVVDTAPALTGQVCGTCGNGQPGEYPYTVECILGWERQDGVLRPLLDGKFEWVPVPQGHGGLPLPVMHPDHSCIAVLGNRPGWTANA